MAEAGVEWTVPWRIAQLASQLFAGVAHLHKHGFVHLGLCPQAVVLAPVGDDLQVVLVDAGLSAFFDEFDPDLAVPFRRNLPTTMHIARCAAPEALVQNGRPGTQ